MNLKDLLGDAYKDGMTVEEIEAALGDITPPSNDSSEIERLKAALSKSNSEAAGYKKQLREKMTEDEQKAQKEAEERAELQEKYDKLLHKTEVSENKARLLALGYDEKLANETAEAMVSGDLEKVFSNQLQHQQNLEKKIRADVLKDTPPPVGGNGDDVMTLEKLKQMSPEQRYEFSIKNSEQYKKLYEGGNE